jgi:serine/threonine protein kinase/tetratricopeptide (TPR) repeat protein
VADIAIQLGDALRDRYLIERELGRGGMATVYLAHDLKHDRKVALKVLHPELAATVGPERFQREIRLAAGLQHPYILPVHDSGETGGHLWYTMPFVDGESLRDRLRRERQLPTDDAIRIAGEVARALECAHAQGVIHRDIKPENILLTASGDALVADFGVARAVGADQEHLTNTGLAVGTPIYMSPEQASGDREVDLRTDLYSLGAVLYEMLAGEPPFTGPTIQAIITRRLTENPRPLRTVRDTISTGIEAVVFKALARVPADRFSSAGQFAAALENSAAMSSASNSLARASPLALDPWRSIRSKAGVLLGMIVVVGAAVLASRGRHREAPPMAAGTAEPTRLAVLPFDNLGDTSEAYLAEGIASEIRGKLANLPALTVIASTSSNQYRNTTESPRKIAQELGVRYLLLGRVQWEKDASSERRVRVSAELVDAGTGAMKWQQPFDASLTSVFQVQADIASRVVEALDVVLGEGQRRLLAQPPTANAAAYDAFLKGEAVSSGDAWDIPTLHRAMGFYERAVTLDSNFVAAWAQLARTRAHVYAVGISSPSIAEAARVAAERARTLAPGRPESQFAWGAYLFLVRDDFAGALEAYETGLQVTPTNVELLTQAGTAEYFLGRWEAAVEHLKQAQALDPRSILPSSRLTTLLNSLRRWREARQEADHVLALVPDKVDVLEMRVETYVGEGDLAGAQNALRAAARAVKATTLLPYVSDLYTPVYWLLDSAQQVRLLHLVPADFDGNRGNWGLALAEIYVLRGDKARVRLYADSARIGLEDVLRKAPDDAGAHSALGVALAYLGRRPEAIREGERGVALIKGPLAKAYNERQLARIYVLVGEREKALDKLEEMLSVPSFFSPGWLRLDPTFAPLSGDARFERLANGS